MRRPPRPTPNTASDQKGEQRHFAVQRGNKASRVLPPSRLTFTLKPGANRWAASDGFTIALYSRTGRRRRIGGHATVYCKVPLAPLRHRGPQIVELRARVAAAVCGSGAPAAAGGTDSHQQQHALGTWPCMLYGELCCNNLYDYAEQVRSPRPGCLL